MEELNSSKSSTTGFGWGTGVGVGGFCTGWGVGTAVRTGVCVADLKEEEVEGKVDFVGGAEPKVEA